MKSVVVCGSKKYAKEITAFCAELEKQGVLVFEPDFKQVVYETDTCHAAYHTAKCSRV